MLSCRMIVAACTIAAPAALLAQAKPSAISARRDSVSIRWIDTELRAALQSVAPYLDRPTVMANGVGLGRVTFETPRPLPRSELPRVLRGLIEAHGLELLTDSVAGIYRIQAKPAPPPPIVQSPPITVLPTAVSGRARASGGVELFTLHLKHVRAQDVAATVNALYGRASAIGELGARPRPLGEDLRDNLVAPAGTPGAPPPPGAIAKVASFSGDVVIVPDARTNSLLVRANHDDFLLVEAAVHEIDVRPLQVLIEVLIVEVRRDQSTSFGLSASAGPVALPGGGTVVASQSGLGLGDFVLTVMGLGGKSVEATLRAATARGTARIVSRPVVIATNNEEASILVGSQRPFVQVQRSLPTEAPSRDQVVQYKDVGTRLIVKPTISEDKYVMLDVLQEVNQATTESQFDAPVISTRNVKTRLLIRDGQTIVLGGLTDRQRDHSQSGIPWLSSIPWIGGLFGRVTDVVNETELLLFIRPQVLRTDADADSATQPKLKKSEIEP